MWQALLLGRRDEAPSGRHLVAVFVRVAALRIAA
jgi:hypothetical protein